MNGKENIISKILSDADEKCRQIIDSAKAQAESISQEAQAQAESEKAALTRRVSAMTAEKIANKQANAELDARKYVLAQKQKLISACYDKAYKQLVSMKGEDKAAFISRLIENFAEQGETVFACKADKDVVTQKFLDGFHKKLTLSKTYLDCDGGIVLSGEGYDKDLTLARVIAHVREKTEAAVASALFGE